MTKRFGSGYGCFGLLEIADPRFSQREDDEPLHVHAAAVPVNPSLREDLYGFGTLALVEEYFCFLHLESRAPSRIIAGQQQAILTRVAVSFGKVS